MTLQARVRWRDDSPFQRRLYGSRYARWLYGQGYWYRGMSIQTPPGNHDGKRKRKRKRL